MGSRPTRHRDPLLEPSLRRLPLDVPGREQLLRAHAAAVAAGRPGYIDPTTGLYVMTAETLLGVGSCCGNGCRHCPYVP